MDTWTLKIVGVGLWKIPRQSLQCHYMMLRWLFSLLRVQLGSYRTLFFVGHKFTLIFHTHSDTSCWTFICLQCCAFGDYFWWQTDNNNEVGRGCGLCVHKIWTSVMEIYLWGSPSNKQDCGLFICHRWTHASFVCRACWRIKCIQRILTLKMWKEAFRM